MGANQSQGDATGQASCTGILVCLEAHDDEANPDNRDVLAYYYNKDGSLPGRLKPGALRARIETRRGSVNLKIGGELRTVEYGVVAQRGYYPSDVHKPNQDAFAVAKDLGGGLSFFAVYDGHGADGHRCAQFGRDHLAGKLRQLSDAHPGADLVKLLNTSHLAVNKAMHAAAFDDDMSGTTAINIAFRDGFMYVSNLGDSRAIVGVDNGDDGLVVQPLSFDQTPYRKDERERCRAAGARILTISMLDGVEPIHDNFDVGLGEQIDEEGDPPRLWLPNAEVPGCAFTRSLGDAVAESIGCIGKPEIMQREVDKVRARTRRVVRGRTLPRVTRARAPDTLSPRARVQDGDCICIIATDGVWEFLTNVVVMSMVAKHTDPLDAALEVCAHSYRLWMEKEGRSDDITITILHLRPAAATPATEAAGAKAGFPQGPAISQQALSKGDGAPTPRKKEKHKRGSFVQAGAPPVEFPTSSSPPVDLPSDLPAHEASDEV